MSTKRKVKKVSEQLITKEIAELKKLIVLVVETDDLLENLEVQSISEFENFINEKSGFVNAMMSATAYGKDTEYNRLLELEKLIDSRLTTADLDDSKELKSSVIAEITEKHTEYYSDAEMKAKKVLEKVMKDFNALSHTERSQIGFSHSAELIYSPFSYLRF
jgi:hypothetical protein